MTIADDRIKNSVERLERLNEEIKGLNSDKADVLAEAKSLGLDTKAIKAVVRDRAKDSQALREEQDLYELYWNAAHGSRVRAGEAAE